MIEKLTFLVQGSATEPYEPTFWKDGDNLTTSCTCLAGDNGWYCKHRFAVMNGDTTNLVSDNKDDVKRLRQMLVGSDVEDANADLAIALEASEKLQSKRKLAAPKRRTHISTQAATPYLVDQGFLTGNDRTHFFDLFDGADHYIGSIPAQDSVFQPKVDKVFNLPNLCSIAWREKTLDKIFCFMAGSDIEAMMRLETKLSEFKIRLKIAMHD